jgi:hypothetical protein
MQARKQERQRDCGFLFKSIEILINLRGKYYWIFLGGEITERLV